VQAISGIAFVMTKGALLLIIGGVALLPLGAAAPGPVCSSGPTGVYLILPGSTWVGSPVGSRWLSRPAEWPVLWRVRTLNVDRRAWGLVSHRIAQGVASRVGPWVAPRSGPYREAWVLRRMP